MNRRSFLSAALAAPFAAAAAVKTFGARTVTQDIAQVSTEVLTYRGIPVVWDSDVPPNRFFIVSTSGPRVLGRHDITA